MMYLVSTKYTCTVGGGKALNNSEKRSLLETSITQEAAKRLLISCHVVDRMIELRFYVVYVC